MLPDCSWYCLVSSSNGVVPWLLSNRRPSCGGIGKVSLIPALEIQTTRRPSLPADLQKLIRTMAADNPTWGEARIADELRLKLGIRVSSRTVRKYLTGGFSSGSHVRSSAAMLTFVHNHAKAIVACDFFVVVTATFGVLYMFVLMEVGTRRFVHCNVSAHPAAERCSNSERRSPESTGIISSFMTGIESTQGTRTPL